MLSPSKSREHFRILRYDAKSLDATSALAALCGRIILELRLLLLPGDVTFVRFLAVRLFQRVLLHLFMRYVDTAPLYRILLERLIQPLSMSL